MWPSKYAKMRFRTSLASSRRSPDPQSAGDETPLCILDPARRSILPPSALATRCLDISGHCPPPEYFSLDRCLAAWWRWARCPICFLPFWYCLTASYKRKMVRATAASCGTLHVPHDGAVGAPPYVGMGPRMVNPALCIVIKRLRLGSHSFHCKIAKFLVSQCRKFGIKILQVSPRLASKTRVEWFSTSFAALYLRNGAR